MNLAASKDKITTVARPQIVRLALWIAAFVLLLGIFYLIHRLIVTHMGPGQDNADIFTKLPIVLTGLGLLWTMLLILFTQMTMALKEDFK